MSTLELDWNQSHESDFITETDTGQTDLVQFLNINEPIQSVLVPTVQIKLGTENLLWPKKLS